jgi:putative drug exporter of the RND superfamily
MKHALMVPLKAVLLNLLSTTSAFGVLVLFFQGFNRSGFKYDVIESFVPPLLFSILFGLSMDYHIFLLSRMTEEFRKSGDMSQAVTAGIQGTFRTITSAALIMIVVFGVIATLKLPIMKQLGVGLAVAIFIDATIIRCALLPASLILLGRWNWYLPRWLKWLPHLSG